MARKRPSAEEVFQKNSEEMSDMERMMAEIMDEKDPVDGNPAENDLDVENIIHEIHSAPIAPAPPAHKARIPKNDGTPEARSVSEENGRTESSASAYSRTMREEREKKIKKESKKRGLRASAIILILCAALVIGAILFKAWSEDFAASMPGARKPEVVNVSEETSGEADPENTLPPDVFIPTPDPENENVKIVEPGSIVIMSAQSEVEEFKQPAPGSRTEHSYELFRENVSWTQAQERCRELGGHLVNIRSQEELDEVIALAESQGLEKVWIGCHRENAQLIWENDEQIDFYRWGKGEPSGYDAGDRVTEDYLLLWKFNGEWVYNDSRNDPVKDYPDMYSGQIGFVCEYEAGSQEIIPLPAEISDPMGNIQPDIPG